ncbi:MAG TPA: hypothetical protein VFF06_05210 [Polyangia bacterium]|nr:hypothetical protein [Polyangia bacterium]
MRAFAVGLVALAAGGGCFGSCQTPMQQGICALGSTAPLDSLEIGTDADPFAPLSDGDTIQSVIGGQGATMVIVRLRVRGAGAPACLAQSTSVLAADGSGDVLSRNDAALETTLEADGARTTPELLLPGRIPRAGEGVIITSLAGGRTVTRALSIDVAGFFDFAPEPDGAGVDANTED